MKAGIVAVFSKRRERYLPIYLEKIKKYLSTTSLDYEIIISEQEDYETTFNFSLCANVGIRCAFEKLNCDYAVLVGPDNIPVENVNYSWKGINEISFLMFGGYKIDRNSFYISQGNNVFMGWGAMWMDVEFYNRLDFYGIKYSKWYTSQEAINSKIIDLSVANSSQEDRSLLIWKQRRPDTFFKDVPTIIPVDDPESDINFTPYSENYWYSDIVRDAHISLTDVLQHVSPEERTRYYEKSGYKRANIDSVNHFIEDDFHYFKYTTQHAFCTPNQSGVITLKISKNSVTSWEDFKDKLYQLVDGRVVEVRVI